jgi:L-glyceraldehyde 3-phosphate reductase
MTYRVAPGRYETMQYRNAGRSGLKLPVISLGLWQNFGGARDYPSAFEMLGAAFDAGITHFDLANNYGPPPGSAEELFGQVMARDFKPYRDELIISSKAGYHMWEGPYGEWGSRKNLIASIRTASIRIRRSKKPWARWPPSLRRARRSMSAFPIIRKPRRGRPMRS